MRAAGVLLCGYTACPPHHKLEQAALGATAYVPWRRLERTEDAITELRQHGVQIIALETAVGAMPYDEFAYHAPTALVLGNEALGVSEPALGMCDAIVDVPVYGFKNSLNVAAAAAVALYEAARHIALPESG